MPLLPYNSNAAAPGAREGQHLSSRPERGPAAPCMRASRRFVPCCRQRASSSWASAAAAAAWKWKVSLSPPGNSRCFVLLYGIVRLSCHAPSGCRRQNKFLGAKCNPANESARAIRLAAATFFLGIMRGVPSRRTNFIT